MKNRIAYQREWRKKNPDKIRRYNREKYLRDKNFNPERLLRKRVKAKEWYQKNKTKHREYQKQWSRNKLGAIKEKIFDKLGHTCKCGFSDKRALCIDHKGGGGHQELRSLSVFKYYKKVLRDTEGRYQILCHNCNWIKRHENNEVRKPK